MSLTGIAQYQSSSLELAGVAGSSAERMGRDGVQSSNITELLC